MTAAHDPEPCVFVLWAAARPRESAILADLDRRFELADVVEVAWRRERFAHNLTRLYGTLLPPGSQKEQECGTGPFLVVVAGDPAPRYGLRRTTRGLRRVNVHSAAAKSRYRRWTGGGFRVHGSLDRHEAERDLRLLLRRGDDVLGRRWDGTIRPGDGDDDVSWATADELLASIRAATPAEPNAAADGRLVVGTEDVWWAALIAGGDPPPEGAREAELDVSIAGATTRLRLEARPLT